MVYCVLSLSTQMVVAGFLYSISLKVISEQALYQIHRNMHLLSLLYSFNNCFSQLACGQWVLSSFWQDATGSFVLPFRQVMYAPYPTTHIDVDVNTVKQMPPCHEHIYNQRRYMRSELTAFWRATSEEDMAQDTIIYTDESFTPDLYVTLGLRCHC